MILERRRMFRWIQCVGVVLLLAGCSRVHYPPDQKALLDMANSTIAACKAGASRPCDAQQQKLVDAASRVNGKRISDWVCEVQTVLPVNPGAWVNPSDMIGCKDGQGFFITHYSPTDPAEFARMAKELPNSASTFKKMSAVQAKENPIYEETVYPKDVIAISGLLDDLGASSSGIAPRITGARIRVISKGS